MLTIVALVVMPQRGKLIVVEGLDRAGKSTQVERLCANLLKDGQRVERMGFPGKDILLSHLHWSAMCLILRHR